MSLDNILKKIGEQAEAERKRILKEAMVQVEKIKDEGKKSASEMEKAAKREEALVEVELKNAILLPARLKVRGSGLSLKQEFIDMVFKEALRFDDSAYKKVLSHLFSKIPKGTEGVVHPARGMEGLTKEFFREKKRIDVKMGDPVDGLMGGFLFKAGRVEFDCSFITLLKKLREKLETEVARFF